MFDVKLDKAKKLLTVVYSGRVVPEESKRCEQEIRRIVADEATVPNLLTDMIGLENMDVACGQDIARVMDLLDCKGVETVVRVIPDPRKDIGLNIMSLFHYRRGVRIVTCETMEEALRVLGE